MAVVAAVGGSGGAPAGAAAWGGASPPPTLRACVLAGAAGSSLAGQHVACCVIPQSADVSPHAFATALRSCCSTPTPQTRSTARRPRCTCATRRPTSGRWAWVVELTGWLADSACGASRLARLGGGCHAASPHSLAISSLSCAGQGLRAAVCQARGRGGAGGGGAAPARRRRRRHERWRGRCAAAAALGGQASWRHRCCCLAA